jgi:hypothetical protein
MTEGAVYLITASSYYHFVFAQTLVMRTVRSLTFETIDR